MELWKSHELWKERRRKKTTHNHHSPKWARLHIYKQYEWKTKQYQNVTFEMVFLASPSSEKCGQVLFLWSGILFHQRMTKRSKWTKKKTYWHSVIFHLTCSNVDTCKISTHCHVQMQYYENRCHCLCHYPPMEMPFYAHKHKKIKSFRKLADAERIAFSSGINSLSF